MKDRIKNIFKVAMLAAAMLAVTVPAKAAPGTGAYTYGITNVSFAATIGATAVQMGLGSGSSTNGPDNLKYNKDCVVVFECDTALTNKLGTYALATIVLQRVLSNGKIDLGNQPIVWIPTAPRFPAADDGAIVGGHVVVSTNLADTVVGPYTGVALMAFTNSTLAGAGSGPSTFTNPVVRIEIKNRISP